MNLSLSQRIQNRLFKRVVDTFGKPIEIRQRIQQGDSAILQTIAQFLDRSWDGVVEEIGRELSPEERVELVLAVREPYFGRRIKETALEDIYSERLCPSLTILPHSLPASNPHYPASKKTFSSKAPVHAVCVEWLPHICNELYPLMIDSYVCDLAKHWRQHRCLIGLRTDWLDDELRANRCIYYQPEPERILEVGLTDPLPINSVHFLAVSPSCHQTWNERFERQNTLSINPYETAARADDKYGCFLDWKDNGVPTPRTALLDRRDALDEIRVSSHLAGIFLEIFREEDRSEINAQDDVILVIQPNRGTEGRGAQAYIGPPIWAMFFQKHPEIIDHVRNVARSDDVLLRQGIANVWLNDPHTGRDVFFDIRANVACGRMESGFFMAAAPGAVIASPGRGGHILEWTLEREWQLRLPDGDGFISWNENLWRDIQQTAEAAASAFRLCKIVGVDIRLHWIDGKIVPHVLDINPRPAGLAHSRYLDTKEPGVTQLLWDEIPD